MYSPPTFGARHADEYFEVGRRTFAYRLVLGAEAFVERPVVAVHVAPS